MPASGLAPVLEGKWVFRDNKAGLLLHRLRTPLTRETQRRLCADLRDVLL